MNSPNLGAGSSTQKNGQKPLGAFSVSCQAGTPFRPAIPLLETEPAAFDGILAERPLFF